PGPFNLASAQRITELLRGAGFAQVRTEEVPMRLAVPDVDQYMALIADIAGPIALALRDLSVADRAEIHAEAEDSLGRFTAGDGYELPGVALCAVAG
ncbi:MAG: hypothetical protein ACRDQW_00015, partial [Haloechinothrix sp.]